MLKIYCNFNLIIARVSVAITLLFIFTKEIKNEMRKFWLFTHVTRRLARSDKQFNKNSIFSCFAPIKINLNVHMWGAWGLGQTNICKIILTCNSLSVFSRAFDFGPGISVFAAGPDGSPCTYELYRQRASTAVKLDRKVISSLYLQSFTTLSCSH